jgi:RNA polymerase sigma factor for flagellar operon FliA
MVELDRDWDSHMLECVPDFQDEINEEAEELRKAVDTLSEQEQNVIRCYYYEDKPMREVALELGVSESRVSQVNTHALKKLRMKLSRKLGRL